MYACYHDIAGVQLKLMAIIYEAQKVHAMQWSMLYIFRLPDMCVCVCVCVFVRRSRRLYVDGS